MIRIEEEVFDTKEFKAEFWKWFDALDKSMRDVFNYHKSDFAKLNFYNTAWKKKNINRV